MINAGFEICRPARDFYVRVAQGECVIDSFLTLAELTDIFNEADLTRDKFGSTEEGNRVRVYTLSFTIAEAKE